MRQAARKFFGADYQPRRAVPAALKVVSVASAVVVEDAEAEADLADEAWIILHQ